MKYLNCFLFVICITISSFGQEIPSGVRYKKAPEEVNDLAKTGLEKLFTSDAFPSDFFADATVIGPSLWKGLKQAEDPTLIKSKPVMLIVPGKPPFSAEGKAISVDKERNAFWKLFRSKYPDLKTAKIRKAKADEISYYWATIPFDIEEPFWVIETVNDRFIANFQVKSGQPKLFWIDLVGDFEKLRQ
jgi:hypothetical protein